MFENSFGTNLPQVGVRSRSKEDIKDAVRHLKTAIQPPVLSGGIFCIMMADREEGEFCDKNEKRKGRKACVSYSRKRVVYDTDGVEL